MYNKKYHKDKDYIWTKEHNTFEDNIWDKQQPLFWLSSLNHDNPKTIRGFNDTLQTRTFNQQETNYYDLSNMLVKRDNYMMNTPKTVVTTTAKKIPDADKDLMKNIVDKIPYTNTTDYYGSKLPDYSNQNEPLTYWDIMSDPNTTARYFALLSDWATINGRTPDNDTIVDLYNSTYSNTLIKEPLKPYNPYKTVDPYNRTNNNPPIIEQNEQFDQNSVFNPNTIFEPWNEQNGGEYIDNDNDYNDMDENGKPKRKKKYVAPEITTPFEDIGTIIKTTVYGLPIASDIAPYIDPTNATDLLVPPDNNNTKQNVSTKIPVIETTGQKYEKIEDFNEKEQLALNNKTGMITESKNPYGLITETSSQSYKTTLNNIYEQEYKKLISDESRRQDPNILIKLNQIVADFQKENGRYPDVIEIMETFNLLYPLAEPTFQPVNTLVTDKYDNAYEIITKIKSQSKDPDIVNKFEEFTKEFVKQNNRQPTMDEILEMYYKSITKKEKETFSNNELAFSDNLPTFSDNKTDLSDNKPDFSDNKSDFYGNKPLTFDEIMSDPIKQAKFYEILNDWATIYGRVPDDDNIVDLYNLKYSNENNEWSPAEIYSLTANEDEDDSWHKTEMNIQGQSNYTPKPGDVTILDIEDKEHIFKGPLTIDEINELKEKIWELDKEKETWIIRSSDGYMFQIYPTEKMEYVNYIKQHTIDTPSTIFNFSNYLTDVVFDIEGMPLVVPAQYSYQEKSNFIDKVNHGKPFWRIIDTDGVIWKVPTTYSYDDVLEIQETNSEDKSKKDLTIWEAKPDGILTKLWHAFKWVKNPIEAGVVYYLGRSEKAIKLLYESQKALQEEYVEQVKKLVTDETMGPNAFDNAFDEEALLNWSNALKNDVPLEQGGLHPGELGEIEVRNRFATNKPQFQIRNSFKDLGSKIENSLKNTTDEMADVFKINPTASKFETFENIAKDIGERDIGEVLVDIAPVIEDVGIIAAEEGFPLIAP
jgi:hypothetical protein